LQVDSAKKQYNVQISRLTEELSALQMVWCWLVKVFLIAKRLRLLVFIELNI